jgi:hypothetical protein
VKDGCVKGRFNDGLTGCEGPPVAGKIVERALAVKVRETQFHARILRLKLERHGQKPGRRQSSGQFEPVPGWRRHFPGGVHFFNCVPGFNNP